MRFIVFIVCFLLIVDRCVRFSLCELLRHNMNKTTKSKKESSTLINETPENKKEPRTIMNVALAKRIGLIQLLNPETVKYRSYNVYRIAIILGIVLYELPLSIVFLAQSAYYCTSDTNTSILSLASAENILFICFKIGWVIFYSDDICQCLEVAQFDFMSYGRYNRRLLETWQSYCMRISYVFFALTWFCYFYCVYSTLLLKDTFIPVKDPDGSVGDYRFNLLNLYFFTSSETYNKYFSVFYIVEVVYVSFGVFFFNHNDIIVITLCLALTCQFRMISDAFESVGQNYFNLRSSEYFAYFIIFIYCCF